MTKRVGALRAIGGWNMCKTKRLIAQCNPDRQNERTYVHIHGHNNTTASKMPTDVISACRAEHFEPSFGRKKIDTEQKSGFLILLSQSGIRKDVRVVVYRTSLEHFAVIYPRKRLSKPFSVVNLKNTAVECDGNGFFVKQRGFENTVTARFVCPARDVEGWVAAFSNAAQVKSCQLQSLPVLIEAEES